MKKILSVLVMVIISLLLLLPLHLNTAPNLEDISSFDPSRYDCTYSLQTFRLKAHDRQWTLASVTEYNADGQIQWEQTYQLDAKGQSYYMDNGQRRDVSRYPRSGMENITGDISDWSLSEEKLDEFGRVVYRMGESPTLPGHHDLASWYYCPNTDTVDDSNISVFARTMHEVSSDGIEPVCYGADDEPLMEFNTYEITNLDCYGNETRICWDGKCYLKTGTDGYLQMIISENPGTYDVLRIDESGKPLWSAIYHKENLSLISYTVWRYAPRGESREV